MDDELKFPLSVYIKLRDKVSGFEKVLYQSKYRDVDHVLYQWIDGNYSCDCNRSLLLWDWNGEKTLECSSGENQIELISIHNAKTGEVIYG